MSVKKNVLILCGGVSAEHEISIISSRSIISALPQEFNPVIVGISRKGVWYHLENLNGINEIADNHSTSLISSLVKQKDGTYLKNDKASIVIDVAFPVLHGTLGEDGAPQGLLEMMELPYVGCTVLSSSISMDKDIFKQILINNGIQVAPYKVSYKGEKILDFSAVVKDLGSEILFIKPSRAGSSVGISKVRDENEYIQAVNLAFEYCDKIIIEKYIKGKEVECAVLGNESPKASMFGEIRSNHEFYTYEAKYLDPNGAEYIIPATIDAETSLKAREIAVKVFKLIECKGMARVDFFVTDDKEIVVNEINTIPGFTSISLYPTLWDREGLPYSDLIRELINLAVEDYKSKKGLRLSPFLPNRSLGKPYF